MNDTLPITGRRNGSFEFCDRCSSNSNCCVRFRQGLGEVASPPLLGQEAEAIAANTGLNVADFAERDVFVPSDIAIKRTGNGCYFYRNGRCQIYSLRPLDCKIFPYSIINQNDHFFWIIYTDLCPSITEAKFRGEHFFAVKQLFRDSRTTLADLASYVRHGRDIMAPHKYELIEPVDLAFLK